MTAKICRSADIASRKLNYDRLQDLLHIIQLRGGIPEQLRTEFLFFASCFLSWGHEPEILKTKIKEFALQYLPQPEWSDKLIHDRTSSVIKRAEMAATGQTLTFRKYPRDPRYRPTTKNLMAQLLVTDEEEQLLKTIKRK